MIRKILSPTDGSEQAEKAVSLACDLAAKYGAELILLHVQLENTASEDLRHFAEVEGLAKSVRPEVERLQTAQEQQLVAGGSAMPEPISADLLDRIADHALKSAAQIANSKHVGEISLRVERGNTGKRILACARREEVDMIVMGRRGLSNLQGLLLGSNSQYVSNRADCTCVTVN